MTDYLEFLAGKRVAVAPAGVDIPATDINPSLFPFQRDVVRWALRLGRAALFANVGLGKTAMQLEWARHVAAETGRPVLILAPLAVEVEPLECTPLDEGALAWVEREFPELWARHHKDQKTNDGLPRW